MGFQRIEKRLDVGADERLTHQGELRREDAASFIKMRVDKTIVLPRFALGGTKKGSAKVTPPFQKLIERSRVRK
jgi:hypothetical protein